MDDQANPIPSNVNGALQSARVALPILRQKAKLTAFYLSKDRVLTLMGSGGLPHFFLEELRRHDGSTPSAILSNELGSYLFDAIASGGIKSLQQLAYEQPLKTGTPFIYDGHVFGRGFAQRNKTPALSLTEKLDEPLAGKTLVVEFSKTGLLNSTAYTRLAGSTRLFVFGYVTDSNSDTIRAVPYVIGDIVQHDSFLQAPFVTGLELQPEQIEQFGGMDLSWMPNKTQLAKLKNTPERVVKELIGRLLGEAEVPRDWGGEECDLFSANLKVNGLRRTGAFLLKGPAAFHPMTMADCGKNGDQIYRLFNIPAHIYVIQHCHYIGAAVRKTVEAFALARNFTSSCHYMIFDGVSTARLLRAHGLW